MTGKQLKLQGLELAASKYRESLAVAQLLAQFIGRKQETVSADDVFRLVSPSALGQAAGALFRGNEWEFVGWKESTRGSNHARPIRVWRLLSQR